MAIFCMTNRAGGTSKTSLATNLAALWARDRRVLLLDLDEQADGSAWLGVDDTGAALAEALTGTASLEEAILTTECGVDVAPGGEALAHISDTVRPDAVRRAIETVSHRGYEVIVIDCAPSLMPIVHAAWLAGAAVQAIVPVDNPKALRGVARLRNAWEDAGLNLAAMRIAIVRYDGRRVLDRELDRQTRALYGPAVLQSRVRESVVVPESSAWGRPLSLHAPQHPLTADLRRLAEEVLHG